MDKLAAMQVFVRVVEAGGLSAAGRQLGLAPASVSRRINDLEAMLGVKLLQRTTRNLSLTEDGETYYERAREIIKSVEEANLLITAGKTPSGILRVSTASSLTRLHIAPAIAEFQAQYPNIRIVLRVSDQFVDLVGEGIDVALRIGRQESSSLIARKLGQCRRILCASPRYLNEAGHPQHPDDLSEHACLSYRSHASVNLWQFRKGKQRIDARVTGPFFADDGETLVAAAAAGMGIILVPEWLAGDALRSGRLTEILQDYDAVPAQTPLYALYTPGPYVAPKIRVFVDFLAQRFSQGYDWRGAD